MNCGSYGSFSIYSTAEVLVLRGIKCKRAREVAIPFDRNGKQIGGFRCSLAKNDLPVLFSCGKGAKKGNIRKFPQALIVRGVGSPRPNPSAR